MLPDYIRYHDGSLFLVWENYWEIPNWLYRLCGPSRFAPNLCCYNGYENALEWRIFK
jgi:hypothetical protein